MERLTRRDWSRYGFYDKETPILGARQGYELYQRLGRYEDAEEQGLLLHLPCKVGDTVWQIMITGMRGKKILYKIYEATVIKWTVDIYNNLLISVITIEKFIEQKYSDSETTNDIKDQMLFDLSCQQTAFNLDKIMKQLEYQNNIWNHNEVADIRLIDEKRKAYAMAIEIVKNGGVDNRGKPHIFEINDKNKIDELETFSVDEKLREQSQKIIEKYKMKNRGDN